MTTRRSAVENLSEFLRPYLDNPDYTEIAINQPGEIWCYGKTWERFESEITELNLERLCMAMAKENDELFTRSDPIRTVMLEVDKRAHMTRPPFTRFHTVTIRKPSRNVFTPDHYRATGMFEMPKVATIDQRLNEMYAAAIRPDATADQRLQFCLAAVAAGKTTAVAGATGSGKTALLNMLISAIDSTARLLVCEDAQEIRYPNHLNSIGLRFASSGKVGDLSVTPTEALKSCMRMLPTRIIFGELRDGDKAASEWLSACNSGHSGSLTTVHAGSAQECYSRLIKMARQSDNSSPYEAVKADVMAAVDLVIHVGFVDGQRVVTEIAYTP